MLNPFKWDSRCLSRNGLWLNDGNVVMTQEEFTKNEGCLLMEEHAVLVVLTAIYYIMQIMKQFQWPTLNTHDSAILAFSAEILHA